MGKVTKFFLYVLCSILLLVSLGAISLLLLFNPNDYKEEICKTFYNKTGSSLKINGDIAWSFFPLLSLQINDVVISNPPSYPSTKPLAKLGKIDFSIKFLPLLQHHLETKNIKLNDIEVNLIQKTAIEHNLTNLVNYLNPSKQTARLGEQPSHATASKATNTSFNPNFKVKINNITISNARLHWDHLANKRQGTILIQLLQSNQLNQEGRPFPINFTLNLEPDRTSITMQTSATMQINTSEQYLQLSNLKVDMKLNDPQMPHHKMAFTSDSNIRYHFADKHLAITDFIATLDDLTMRGQITGQTSRLQAEISTNHFNSLSLLEFIGLKLKLPNPKMLENTQFSFNLLTKPQQLTLNAIDLQLNNMAHLTGYCDIMTQVPQIKGKVQIDTLDLNQWLPFTMTKTTTKPLTELSNHLPKATHHSLPSSPHHATPLDKLKQVDVLFIIEQLQYQKLKLSHILSKLIFKNTSLTYHLLDSQFYGGKISGINSLQLKTKPFQIKIHEEFQKVALQPLLIDLANYSGLRGTASGMLDLVTQGLTSETQLANLNGKMAINIYDGELMLFDALRFFDLAAAIYRQLSPPKMANDTVTTFQKLTGEFIIHQGIAKTKDIILLSPSIAAKGQGYIDLKTKKLKLRFELKYQGDQRRILDIQQKIGGSVPVIVHGHLNNLVTDLDYGLLMQRIAITRIDKTVAQNSKKFQKNIARISAQVSKHLEKLNLQP